MRADPIVAGAVDGSGVGRLCQSSTKPGVQDGIFAVPGDMPDVAGLYKMH